MLKIRGGALGRDTSFFCVLSNPHIPRQKIFWLVLDDLPWSCVPGSGCFYSPLQWTGISLQSFLSLPSRRGMETTRLTACMKQGRDRWQMPMTSRCKRSNRKRGEERKFPPHPHIFSKSGNQSIGEYPGGGNPKKGAAAAATVTALTTPVTPVTRNHRGVVRHHDTPTSILAQLAIVARTRW